MNVDLIKTYQSIMEDDPIKRVTGKYMSHWTWLLEAWKGDKSSSEMISRYLIMHYRLPSFWARAIAIRYLKLL
jgi:hypothetical protein